MKLSITKVIQEEVSDEWYGVYYTGSGPSGQEVLALFRTAAHADGFRDYLNVTGAHGTVRIPIRFVR